MLAVREARGFWETWLIAKSVSPPECSMFRALTVVSFLFTMHQGEEGVSKLLKSSLFTFCMMENHEERFR